MTYFRYFGEKLFVENISVQNIARKNKTPFYLYSEQQVKKKLFKFFKNF